MADKTGNTTGKTVNEPEDIFAKAMRWDYYLSGFDTLMSGFMALQSQLAKKPEVGRVAAPQITMKPYYDTTESALAEVKKNTSSVVSTLLNRSKETGDNSLSTSSSIMAKALSYMNPAIAQLSQQRQQLVNQANTQAMNVEFQNAQLSYQNARDYINREAEIMSRDSMMRSQQFSQAISNIGGIASRLINDVLMKHMITD